jgi:hypothetical protein
VRKKIEALRAESTFRAREKIAKEIPERFKTPEFCLAFVSVEGRALEFVPDRLRTLEMCLAAVEQDGKLLMFVPDDLREQVEKAVGGAER